MKSRIVLLLLIFSNSILKAQELFVYTEPASVMPTNMLSVRCWQGVNYYNKEITGINYFPEIHYGISKKIMFQIVGNFNNYFNNSWMLSGGNIYLQYKFLNLDEVKKHFRMAAFTRVGINKDIYNTNEINMQMLNSGYKYGLIATQLLHKIALSSTIAFEKNINSLSANNSALDYSFSMGKLMLPKKYIGYKQTNVNLMCEFLGQQTLQTDYKYLDMAPSLQFIIHSKARIDLSYRTRIFSNLYNQLKNTIGVRLEYNFYNVF